MRDQGATQQFCTSTRPWSALPRRVQCDRSRTRCGSQLRRIGILPVAPGSVDEIAAARVAEHLAFFSCGTCGGGGQGINTFLKVGDVMETEIEGLGKMRNRFVAEAAAGL
jgi:hypothetical protein